MNEIKHLSFFYVFIILKPEVYRTQFCGQQIQTVPISVITFSIPIEVGKTPHISGVGVSHLSEDALKNEEQNILRQIQHIKHLIISNIFNVAYPNHY